MIEKVIKNVSSLVSVLDIKRNKMWCVLRDEKIVGEIEVFFSKKFN
jgi:hypothetical protein